MKTVRLIKDITLVVTALTLLLSAIASIYFQTAFLTIASRSMEPTIKAGDMVLTRVIPASNIRKRDVVVLRMPNTNGIYYSHRVIQVVNKGSEVVVKTQGDANPNPDRWELAITSKEVAKVMAVIPTAKVLNGPIKRKWIYYSLFYGGALLALYGAVRLLKR